VEKNKKTQNAYLDTFLKRDENDVLLAENINWWKNVNDDIMSIKWTKKIIKNLMIIGNINEKTIRILIENKRIEGKRRSGKKKYEENKENRILQMKKYYNENKEEIKIQRKEYNTRPETIKMKNTPEKREKRRLHGKKPETRKKQKEIQRKRRENPLIKIYDSIHARTKYNIKKMIKMNAITPAEGKLACSKSRIRTKSVYNELMSRVEKLFKPWMNFKNNGPYRVATHDTKPTWHYDHIIPVKFAIENFKDHPDLFDWVMSVNNIMPIESKLNHIKINRVILEIIPKEAPGYPFTGYKGKIYKTIKDAGLDEDIFRDAYNV
jgi:hypothetical protein